MQQLFLRSAKGYGESPEGLPPPFVLVVYQQRVKLIIHA